MVQDAGGVQRDGGLVDDVRRRKSEQLKLGAFAAQADMVSRQTSGSGLTHANTYSAAQVMQGIKR